MYAKTIVASTGSITPYIVAALFYLAITLPLAKAVGKLEARLANNDGGTSVQKATRAERKALKAAKKKNSVVPEGVGKGPEVGADENISSVEITAM